MAAIKSKSIARKAKPAANKTKAKKSATRKTGKAVPHTKNQKAAKGVPAVSSAAAAVSVGDVVRRSGGGNDGELGRVCAINSIGICCVQFEQTGCMPVPIAALVPANGNPPACSSECSGGC